MPLEHRTIEDGNVRFKKERCWIFLCTGEEKLWCEWSALELGGSQGKQIISVRMWKTCLCVSLYYLCCIISCLQYLSLEECLVSF